MDNPIRERFAHTMCQGDDFVELRAAGIAGQKVHVDILRASVIDLPEPILDQFIEGRVRARACVVYDRLPDPVTQLRIFAMPRCRSTRTLPAVRPSAPATSSERLSS